MLLVTNVTNKSTATHSKLSTSTNSNNVKGMQKFATSKGITTKKKNDSVKCTITIFILIAFKKLTNKEVTLNNEEINNSNFQTKNLHLQLNSKVTKSKVENISVLETPRLNYMKIVLEQWLGKGQLGSYYLV